MARRTRKSETAQVDGGIKKSPLRHDKNGGELLDPTPMQPPLGYKRTPTLSEQIRMQVMNLKHELLSDDAISETDEEADDFEVGDDFEPMSPHENDHIPPIAELKRRVKEYNAMIEEANREAALKAAEKARDENHIRKTVRVNTPDPQNTSTDRNPPSSQ